MSKTTDILNILYNDPEHGFVSAPKLHKKTQELGMKITLKDIKEFINKQYTAQVNRPVKKAKVFSSIYVPDIRDEYQIDLMIYDRYQYKLWKYIICVVDIHSRYAMALPLTSRKNDVIVKALTSILNVMGNPKVISCDNEFNTQEFHKLALKKDFEFKYSDANDIQKNSIVERFNRTIAGAMQKYRVATNDYDWVSVLPKLIKNYNNTFHGTMKNKPNDIFFGKSKNKQDIIIVPNILKIGDKVRIKIVKTVFSKGDMLTYSDKVYTITNLVKNKYELNDGIMYTANKLRKVDDIVDYEPGETADLIEHKVVQKIRKHTRLNKKAGVDESNIIVEPRERKKRVYTDYV
jgi:hypothetical protein